MGVKTAEFAIDIGSPKNTKECYCRDPDECPKKGENKYFLTFFVQITNTNHSSIYYRLIDRHI